MSKISWFIKENDVYSEKKEHHAGTFRKDEKIVINMQAWNNRWGVKDAEDIISPVLSFRFDSFEDNALLRLCKVIVNQSLELPVTVKDNSAVVVIGETIIGRSNDGDENSYENKNNFIDIRLEIDIRDRDLKENDLKKMYFELHPLS
ncbi:hypothetical protein [Lysinibacillus fusiformis]|uniref:Uncharacterized protein n=1 Tax=Lysinibacillus fusiformis TaxID=28031 RepID=A0A1E4QYD9_9BACI|nr:hypothetical protein [Lysinibacillus fusiformis]MCR8854887.1 hypothetical protein [Lysinibacillus fusiformis]MED4888998.1 hypothetical protein [Lysinibacillus fusiformis]ODV53234.1 hypothetical protein BG258_23310 [Lysinibacillus fusiformis]WKT77130.1 hypothetical protein QYY55_24635 [Lysinibacillus fusiformis]